VSIGEQLVGAERERYGVGLDDQDLVHLGLAGRRERGSLPIAMKNASLPVTAA
jgi:hypothetical protein